MLYSTCPFCKKYLKFRAGFAYSFKCDNCPFKFHTNLDVYNFIFMKNEFEISDNKIYLKKNELFKVDYTDDFSKDFVNNLKLFLTFS